MSAARIARGAARATATIKSGSSEVRVNLRTGALRSQPPPLQFESSSHLPASFSLEDSIWMIEKAVANGKLQVTDGLLAGLSHLRMQAEEEELRLNPH